MYHAAIESLHRCCHPHGLEASGSRVGHHQVWTRDAMIALLGASLVDDAILRDALSASIHTLGEHQTTTGAIPNNVNPESGRPNFRAYADGGLWWIIGAKILGESCETTNRALAWYACQDVDQSGLLSMQESTDWEDLFCTRGKGLYLNCLYVTALRCAGREQDADRVRDRINDFFWYGGDGDVLHHVRHTFSTETPEEQDSLGRKRWLPLKRKLLADKHYVPWLGFRAIGEWFDSLGHALAILAGVTDREQNAAILSFVERHRLADYPMRSIYPVVRPGDPDWRDYYGMLNVPDHYHNGGIWPFIGGFWVAALVKLGLRNEAKHVLERLAALNERGGFNEWHCGTNGEPMGVRDQAWSAGMYIFAYECVRRGEVPYFA